MDATLLGYFILFSSFVQTTLQLSTPESDSYVAAVVEYAAVGNATSDEPLDIIRRNWNNYNDYIEKASRKNVDIIVFPECGLTTMRLPAERSRLRPWATEIPDPTAKETPCTSSASDTPQILRNVSCAAKEYKMYVVINLAEVLPCSTEDPKCPADNVYFYNTNIVFDRNGTLIARYRKFNLFVEPGFNVTPTAELSTFDTDFGVRFGTFICFDLLFQTPAVQLVRQLGITDIAYSTAWFSELPYLTADEVQAAWAYSLDVNVLASGFDNPPNGNSGSGIYAGREGPIQAIIPLKKTSQMLVGTVQKKPRRLPVSEELMNNTSISASSEELPAPLSLSEVPTSTIDQMRFFQDDFKQYNTVLLDTGTEEEPGNFTYSKNIDLCYRNFCCHFEVITESIIEAEDETNSTVNHRSRYYYRLGVFDGVRNFAGISVAGIQVCGIIPCTKRNDIASCGKSFDVVPRVKINFKSIHIKGDRFVKQASLQMPMTLTEEILPLSSRVYEFTVKDASEEGKNEVEVNTKSEVKHLIGLALYGRVFSRDSMTVPKS